MWFVYKMLSSQLQVANSKPMRAYLLHETVMRTNTYTRVVLLNYHTHKRLLAAHLLTLNTNVWLLKSFLFFD